jgi:hypothetical protein
VVRASLPCPEWRHMSVLARWALLRSPRFQTAVLLSSLSTTSVSRTPWMSHKVCLHLDSLSAPQLSYKFSAGGRLLLLGPGAGQHT